MNYAPEGEVLFSWNGTEMGDFDIGSVSWVGGPWMGGPAAFCRGGAGGLAGGMLSIGVAGWLRRACGGSGHGVVWIVGVATFCCSEFSKSSFFSLFFLVWAEPSKSFWNSSGTSHIPYL